MQSTATRRSRTYSTTAQKMTRRRCLRRRCSTELPSRSHTQLYLCSTSEPSRLSSRDVYKSGSVSELVFLDARLIIPSASYISDSNGAEPYLNPSKTHTTFDRSHDILSPMDPSSIALCGGRAVQAVASLPARSSSAPPKQASSLSEVERSNSAAPPDALTSSNLETLHAYEWLGSHIAHGNYGSFDTASAGDEGLLMFPDHVGSGDHHHNVAEAHANVLQPSLGESTMIAKYTMKKIHTSLTCR